MKTFSAKISVLKTTTITPAMRSRFENEIMDGISSCIPIIGVESDPSSNPTLRWLLFKLLNRQSIDLLFYENKENEKSKERIPNITQYSCNGEIKKRHLIEYDPYHLLAKKANSCGEIIFTYVLPRMDVNTKVFAFDSDDFSLTEVKVKLLELAYKYKKTIVVFAEGYELERANISELEALGDAKIIRLTGE